MSSYKKFGECDICGLEEELNKVDHLWLCDDCDDDYHSIDLPDPKLIRFSRSCGKNLLDENAKWRFIYSVKTIYGKWHRLSFNASDRLANIIWKVERPIIRLNRKLKILKATK